MSNFIQAIEGWTRAISNRIAGVGVIGVLAVSAATVFDVLLRWFFNSPIHGLNEITAILLALGVGACIPAGMANRVNINIDLISSRLPEIVYQWLRALGSVLLLGFIALVVWRLMLIGLRLIDLGQTTIVLELPIGASIFVASLIIGLGVIIQCIVVLSEIEKAVAYSKRVALFVLLGALIVVGALIVLPQVWLGVTSWIDGLASSQVALVFFGLMWFGIFLSIPISPAMGLTGLLGTIAMLGPEPSVNMLGNTVRSMYFNENLAVLPLFLLMGAFATVAGLSADIYRLAQSALGHWRGGLAQATIAGSAGFGALTGSSLATAATIGRAALPEMEARGYSRSLAAGTVAAGGTLGQLIPPSTVIVVFALLTELSIGTLFVATIVPALLAAVLYFIAINIVVRFQPDAGPATERAPARTVLKNAISSWQVFVLVGIVLGGIYFGIFTETEAASFGAFGAFLFALLRGKITRETIWDVMRETTTSIGMIYMLIFGAIMFSFMVGISGVPDFFLEVITSITSEPLLIIIIIALCYLVLGTVMDTFAIMIITVPVFTPLIISLGYDPIWWGIVTICLVETGMITPPFGLNLFIIKSIDAKIGIKEVYKGVLPFVAADIVKIALLILFPIIVLWLPSTR